MIPLSVFIVHPDPTIASRIARTVAAAGHAPVLLADGERAIDRFIQEPADVLVVEHFLPGRDGLSTVESIRWAPGGRDAHVILLAARETAPLPLAQLGLRVDALATFVGLSSEDEIASILEALGRPLTGESTRVASVDELSGALARVGLSTSSLDRREVDGQRVVDHDSLTVPGPIEDDAPKWPVIETVMAHAAALPMNDGGSGVQRRPERGGRLTAPPPPLPAEETTREVEASRDARVGGFDAAALEEGRDVGDGARAAAEGSQRVMGRFEDTPFAALLRRLADARVTGGLVCVGDGLRRDTTSGDPPTKIVYFRSGVPVHVRSNLVDECLGQILLRRKRIGIATLEESIRRMRLGHGLQGEILIDMGALAPMELGEALAEQARDKLFDLFGWQQGTYRLSTKLEASSAVIGIELALADILYEGVCAAMPATRLLGLLSPDLERFVIPDAVQLARFVRVRVVPEVRHVLGKIDGTLRLREILSMGSRPGAVAQLVYAMECLGAVRFAELPPRSSRTGEASIAAAPTAAPEAGGPTDLPGASEEPATEPPPFGEGPPELASLPLHAREPDREHDERSAAEAPAIGEAWDDTTSPQRERAPAPPPRIPAANLVGDALRGESGLHATPERDDRHEPQARSIEASIPPPPAGLDAQVDRLFEAERHFRRGNRALDRGKLDEALVAFGKAHELCPDQGEFLAYVGWTRHCLAPDEQGANEAALTELASARDLAPDLHVTHLLHARVLASAGRGPEARKAYLRALELDPSCSEAQDAIAARS